MNSKSKPDLEITGSSPRKHKRGSENRARSRQVAVRLSPAEHALLQAAAAIFGKSAASVLRDAFMASVKVEVQ